MTEPPRPPRRKRYRGTHPRRFEERYKELNPEKYASEQAKVRAQGRTPAGTHVPVMLNEVLAALKPSPGRVYLDCTLGFGGHAQAIGALVAPAPVIGLDLDAEEQARTRARLAALGITLHAHHGNFAGLAKVLKAEQIAGVDLLLADLGVSSMQLDRPERGFSFKHEGPLDMRMDRSRGQTAAEMLAAADEETLVRWLSDFGDEPRAAAVARAIVQARALRPLATSRDLAEVVMRALGVNPRRYKRRGPADTHPAARTFQALRMAVNRELENLEQFLRDLPWVLNASGRAAIITFHSGEERRVRAALQAGLEAGHFSEAELAGQAPQSREVFDNPRARSARLFWAQRAV